MDAGKSIGGRVPDGSMRDAQKLLDQVLEYQMSLPEIQEKLLLERVNYLLYGLWPNSTK